MGLFCLLLCPPCLVQRILFVVFLPFVFFVVSFFRDVFFVAVFFSEVIFLFLPLGLAFALGATDPRIMGSAAEFINSKRVYGFIVSYD